MLITVATKYKLPLPVFFITYVLIFSPLISSIPSYASSPYDSGYDHGCDDAGISDSLEQYINQPEKGPSYHTSEFMDGYYAGLNSCSTNDNPQLSDGLESSDESYCDEVSNSYDGYCWDRNYKDPTVYCDQVDELGPNETCHDRKDASDVTGLYTCLDGSQEEDWRDCEGGDVEETN